MPPQVHRMAILGLVLLASAAVGQDEHSIPMIDQGVKDIVIHTPDVSETVPSVPDASTAPVIAAAGPVAPSAKQPVGALSGRIVFMNCGHGWTYHTNNFWYLQRPTGLNSMNEDYGNLDQLNFFATYCFNAGAIIASMRPLGQQTNEVVLDNDDTAVTFAGSWSNSGNLVFFGSPGDVAYRFASFSATETATATYTPTIPVAGYYPVYTWVLAGSDRGDQLYRIRHTGGETLYRVPHHMVGNGWVYLGEYYFNAGSNAASGSVVISNLRDTATGSVVIADAIRFGNGMGSVDRGTGVSGYPREEESCRYWIQANLGQGQATSLYDTTSPRDETDSWSAPGRMSAEMNREAAGTIYKRVHISFHSNAGGQRGCEGLITGTSTPNQAALAQICGSTVNDELVSLGSPPLESAWFDRGTNITFSGGYGEISNDNFVNEMDATIIEVAYHDSATDAALMRDSKVRAAIGRSAMHAVVKYFNQFDAASPPPLIFLPEPPVNPRATGATNGFITLTWSPPVSVANSGTPTNYVIYVSTNGYGFGNAISVGTATNYTITSLTAGRDYYFRICAANAGGESLPSEVVGCRATNAATRVLYVNAFDRFDRTTNLRQNLVAQNYVPPNGSGSNERVLPRRVNSFDYVVPHGKALAAFGAAFDSCQSEAVASGAVSLTNYSVVIWACGNESTADESFSTTEQTKVSAYLAASGNLFVSGSEIAWDLDRPSGPTAADRAFLHNQLHATYSADSSSAWAFKAAGASLFVGNPNDLFDDGPRGIYLVGFPDVITATGTGAQTAVSYTNNLSAGISYNGSVGGGKVVYFGFPFETITSTTARNEYLADVLNFFTRPLRFDAVTALASNRARLTLSGAPGVYTVQTAATPNASWGAWQNLTNTGSTFEVTDATTNAAARFYRAKFFP
ncbi:MAG: fibronectin type III domain-containing protein [Verrucomicrobiota bacterium]